MIAPLEDSLTSFMMKEGFSKEDELIVLVPEEKVSKGLAMGEKEVQELKKKLKDIGIDIDFRKKILNTQDFEMTVRKISDLLSTIENDVIVNLTGGNERLIIALTLCTFYHKNVKGVYNPTSTQKNEELEYPRSDVELTDNEQKFLETVVERGELTITELVEHTGLSKSTLSRLGSKFVEKDILESRSVKKEKVFRPKLAAELLIDSM